MLRSSWWPTILQIWRLLERHTNCNRMVHTQIPPTLAADKILSSFFSVMMLNYGLKTWWCHHFCTSVLLVKRSNSKRWEKESKGAVPSSSIHFMVKSWSLSMEHMSLTSPYRPSYDMDGSKWVIMMSLQRKQQVFDLMPQTCDPDPFLQTQRGD